MDPDEEVAQQGQLHPPSPAYVPDPMELDEHVPVHVSEPEHLEYHAPSDDDIQVEDDDEDPDEDPSEKHELEDDDEDPKEDPNEEHELEDSDETEPFEDDETAVTPPPPRHRRARIFVRPQTPMAAFTYALIDAFAAGSSLFPLPPTSPTYDQAPLGHKAYMIHRRDDIPEKDMPPQRRFAFTAPSPGCDIAESSAAARAPRSQYDFVDTVEAGQGMIRSSGYDARTIARATDRVEDVGYVRALQASERKMMTSIEEVLHVSEPEHLEYHAPSDDDIQVEDDDEDPEEDPSEKHELEDDDEDPEEDPNKEHEPEDSDETEPFEEDETAALIDAFAAGSSLFPLPPTSPTYDQAPLESSAAAARAPRSQYDFVDTVEAGQGLIRSSGHDGRTIARATDRVEDVGYVRALQASERKMMTSIEEVCKIHVKYRSFHRIRAKARKIPNGPSKGPRLCWTNIKPTWPALFGV
uniref:Uncharacterized protein n=1 Tax=Tanacetum cinerariifolium TaxID=118510 RepID=A0A699IFV3_TANCI|nr:hypothetical protein [Tanacetum cinerariifolium]